MSLATDNDVNGDSNLTEGITVKKTRMMYTQSVNVLSEPALAELLTMCPRSGEDSITPTM